MITLLRVAAIVGFTLYLPLITGTKKLFADFFYAAYISDVDTRVNETLETILY